MASHPVRRASGGSLFRLDLLKRAWSDFRAELKAAWTRCRAVLRASHLLLIAALLATGTLLAAVALWLLLGTPKAFAQK